GFEPTPHPADSPGAPHCADSTQKCFELDPSRNCTVMGSERAGERDLRDALLLRRCHQQLPVREVRVLERSQGRCQIAQPACCRCGGLVTVREEIWGQGLQIE